MKKNVINLPDVVGSGYRDYWLTKCRYVACKGSRGSKKSKTTALWLIYNIIKYPEANALCVRRYGNTLRDSCFSDLKWACERLKVLNWFSFTVSPMEITYIPTGQKILFRGLDLGTKLTSISVPKGVLCWVWVEEAYEIEEDDFNKLDMSIRGESDHVWKRIMLTFNPWSANCWLKKRFFDVEDPDIFTRTTTWQCNEWLDEADRGIFLKMKEQNPRRYLIEGEGEWGVSESLIYEGFKRESFDPEELRKQDGVTAAFGLDFGYTDPNAFVCALIDRVHMKLYVFDEWYKTGVTNREIAQAIREKGYGGQRIICDSAEPKSITELRDEGIDAEGSRKGRDSVLFGIQQIQNYQIIVHPRCGEFWREINNYAWEKDRNGNSLEKPEHEFSHGMDALRYGVGKSLLPDTFSFD